MRGEDVLQGSQFFRQRISRAQQYEKDQKSHNGHAATDDDEVREVDAHKNVFHRP